MLHAVGGRGKLRIKRQFLLFLWMFTYKDIHITAGIIAKRKTVLSRQYTRSPLLCLQLDSPPLFLCPGAVVLLVWFLCCSAGVGETGRLKRYGHQSVTLPHYRLRHIFVFCYTPFNGRLAVRLHCSPAAASCLVLISRVDSTQ